MTWPSPYRQIAPTVLACGVLLSAALAAATSGSQERPLAEDILEQLVVIRSSAAFPQQIRAAAEAMADRLLGAGFPAQDVQVLSPDGEKGMLVARYRGSGARRPILLMAHIDVVDAEPSAWSFPPFELGKDERYFYGRGTIDNKAGAAMLVANFIRLRQEGFVPDRDLILVLTGDEETDGRHIDWLVNEHRDLVDAEIALNTDAGGGLYDANGEPQMFFVQTSEKIYQSFELTVSNPGGHSSVPSAENAIYRLAAALGRLAKHRFPIHLNDGTRLNFELSAEFSYGALAEDMRAIGNEDLEAATRLAASVDYYNALLRTTCVATRLSAGHADNALPRTATAIVNCRILPNETPDEIEAALREVLADENVSIDRVETARISPPSPLTPEVVDTLSQLVQEMWAGTPVIPSMSTGATDGLFVRSAGIPVYGFSAIFGELDDNRAHGLDERLGIEEFQQATEYWYRALRAFSSRVAPITLSPQQAKAPTARSAPRNGRW